MAINNIVSTLSVGNGIQLNSSSLSISPQYLQIASGTISASAFKDMQVNAITIVSRAAGYIIVPTQMILQLVFNNTAYAAGSNVLFMYESAIVVSTQIPAAQFYATASEVSSADLAFPHPNTIEDMTNVSLQLTVAGGNFTTGDSPVNYFVQYFLMPV